jgi:hypothetical protein
VIACERIDHRDNCSASKSTEIGPKTRIEFSGLDRIKWLDSKESVISREMTSIKWSHFYRRKILIRIHSAH